MYQSTETTYVKKDFIQIKNVILPIKNIEGIFLCDEDQHKISIDMVGRRTMSFFFDEKEILLCVWAKLVYELT